MYKIRFARWGFVKNTPRSAASTPNSSANANQVRRKANRSHRPRPHWLALPESPLIAPNDALTLNLLTSIRIWSVAFFETLPSSPGHPPVLRLQPRMHQPWLEVSKEASSTFRLVIDLLEDGHGRLAGRMVRKAFLLLENMLALEAPALIWNLLEIMHNMVTLRNMQLFQILVDHLARLAGDTMPKKHPLRVILDGLHRAVANLNYLAYSRSSSSSGSSASRESTASADQLNPLSPDLLFLLEQAWLINADILFTHFNPEAHHLYQLYFQINWDACVLGRPTAIVEAASQWFQHIDNQRIRVAPAEYDDVYNFLAKTATDETKLLYSLLAHRGDFSPPQDYKMLRANVMASLRVYAKQIIGGIVNFHGSATTLLRLMAALGNAKFLDHCDAVLKASSPADDQQYRVPRIQAANLSCAIKTLMDLDPTHEVERLRSIVALAEYARGETHPQVVQDMWKLSRALLADGQYEQADAVKSNVLQRLEAFTQHIPENSI